MIDKKIFFIQYKKHILLGDDLSQKLVDALNVFINFMEKDTLITSAYQRAYIMATVQHETAHTFLPIREKGDKEYFIRNYWDKPKVRKQLGNKVEKDAWDRSGAGFAQCTGLGNDIKLTESLPSKFPELINKFELKTRTRFNLVDNHWQLLDAEIAYATISYGMYSGLFTGRKISSYITEVKNDFIDYKEARRVINRQDKAKEIANLALKFESILITSLIK